MATHRATLVLPPPPCQPSALALGLGLVFLLTGATMVFVAAFVPLLPTTPMDDRTVAVTRAAAEEFYAAQDEALATGDARRLIAAVGPSFVDHQPNLAAASDRVGLVAAVLALRQTQPGADFTAETFLVQGDRALVYVSLHPSASVRDGAAGTPTPPTSADTVEVLRIAGGVVAERWHLAGATGPWPPLVITPTATPSWSPSRMATATAEGQVCLASACH